MTKKIISDKEPVSVDDCSELHAPAEQPVQEPCTGADAPEAAPEQTQSAAESETPRTQPSARDVDDLLRKRVYASVAMGFVPVPIVDLVGLTGIQIEMIASLCRLHGIAFKKQWIKSSVSSLASTGLSVLAVPAIGSLLKAIPVIGLPAGAASISLTGAATTYALGRVFDRHFRHGGTLQDFDAQKAKAYFADKLEEGKQFAARMRDKKSEDVSVAEPDVKEAPAQV